MLLILRRIGWFVMDHWRIVAVVVAVLIIVGFLMSYCGKKSATIDQETTNKINNANEKDRKEELRQEIEKNTDAVKTVDNRTTIAETNVDQRNREIDAKVKEADQKITEAKQQGHDVTQDELECILTGNLCK